MNPSAAVNPFRWLVLSVFVFSTAINYLDRQTLATVAPLLRSEFHLSNAGYGMILMAFSITYAASAPLAGLWIDRIGLRRAISIAVGLWSCAGMTTGLTRGMGSLVGCRSVLGVAEAAGIPAAGKAIHQYLQPAERALGNGLNQAAVSLGMVLAPPLATFIAIRAGWRQAFFLTGLAGLAWVPLWNWVSRRVPPETASKPQAAAPASILRDRRLWIFVAANSLPLATTPGWASAGISLSIFAVSAFSVNMYSLPLDVFGGARAAFAVSLLVASYGAVQSLISPVFGKIIDLHGYAALIPAVSLAPLAACGILWQTGSTR